MITAGQIIADERQRQYAAPLGGEDAPTPSEDRQRLADLLESAYAIACRIAQSDPRGLAMATEVQHALYFVKFGK